jgi:hypothetical protein
MNYSYQMNDSFDGYFPRQASEIISDKLGTEIGFSKYYKLIIKFGITDENHCFLQPYDDGCLFWLEYQKIINPITGKVFNTKFEVVASMEGIDRFVSLYKQYFKNQDS